MVESAGRVTKRLSLNPVPPVTGPVSLGNLFTLCVPQLPHRSKQGHDKTWLIRLLRGLNKFGTASWHKVMS